MSGRDLTAEWLGEGGGVVPSKPLKIIPVDYLELLKYKHKHLKKTNCS